MSTLTDHADEKRRRFLTASTALVGATGVAAAAWPFIASWQPSDRARAAGASVVVWNDVACTQGAFCESFVYRGIGRTLAPDDGVQAEDSQTRADRLVPGKMLPKQTDTHDQSEDWDQKAERVCCVEFDRLQQ